MGVFVLNKFLCLGQGELQEQSRMRRLTSFGGKQKSASYWSTQQLQQEELRNLRTQLEA